MSKDYSIAELKTQVSAGNYEAFCQYLNSNLEPLPMPIGDKTYHFENGFAISSYHNGPPDRRLCFQTEDYYHFSHALLNTTIDSLTIGFTDLNAYKAKDNEKFQSFLNHLSNNKNLKSIILFNVSYKHYAELANITMRNKNILLVTVLDYAFNETNIVPFISALGPQVESLVLDGAAITDKVLLRAAEGFKQKEALTRLILAGNITSDGILKFSQLIKETNLTETPINLTRVDIQATQNISDHATKALNKALSNVKDRIRDQRTARKRAVIFKVLLDNPEKTIATQTNNSNNSANTNNSTSLVNKDAIRALNKAISVYKTPETKPKTDKEIEKAKTRKEFDELNGLLYNTGLSVPNKHTYAYDLLNQITAFAYGDTTLSKAEQRNTHQKFADVIVHHSKQSDARSNHERKTTQLSPFFPFDETVPPKEAVIPTHSLPITKKGSIK